MFRGAMDEKWVVKGTSDIVNVGFFYNGESIKHYGIVWYR